MLLPRRFYSQIVNKAFVKEAVSIPNKAVLIDVREPDEYVFGCIPKSTNISVNEIYHALRLENRAFERKYGVPKPKLDDPILFYCQSGRRSAMASEIAEQLGYKM